MALVVAPIYMSRILQVSVSDFTSCLLLNTFQWFQVIIVVFLKLKFLWKKSWSAFLRRKVTVHLHLLNVEDSCWGIICFEVRVSFWVRVLFLEVNIFLEFCHVFTELRKFNVKIFNQLLGSYLLCAAIYDELFQILFALLATKVFFLPCFNLSISLFFRLFFLHCCYGLILLIILLCTLLQATIHGVTEFGWLNSLM